MAFAWKHIGDNGIVNEYRITEVLPLNYPQLVTYLQSNCNSCRTEAIGTPLNKSTIGTPSCRISMLIDFKGPVPYYALVRGGVLPLVYAQDHTLLLDRNIVTALRRDLDNSWPIDFVDFSSTKINPLLAAFEGTDRRMPTYDSFVTEVRNIEQAVRRRMKSVKVTAFGDAALRVMYRFRESFADREAKEIDYLMYASQELVNRVGASCLGSKRDNLDREAACIGLPNPSLVRIAVLSKLYESNGGAGSDFGVGQKIVKFRPGYTRENAYNALADIRQLEFLAAGHGLLNCLALITQDKGLALLWSGLGYRGSSSDNISTTVSLNPNASMFPRLPSGQMSRLLFN